MYCSWIRDLIIHNRRASLILELVGVVSLDAAVLVNDGDQGYFHGQQCHDVNLPKRSGRDKLHFVMTILLVDLQHVF